MIPSDKDEMLSMNVVNEDIHIFAAPGQVAEETYFDDLLLDPADVYMVPDDDGTYDDDSHYGLVSGPLATYDQYEGMSQEYVNAHYLISHGVMNQEKEQEVEDDLSNEKTLAAKTTEERLAENPKQKPVPSTRKIVQKSKLEEKPKPTISKNRQALLASLANPRKIIKVAKPQNSQETSGTSAARGPPAKKRRLIRGPWIHPQLRHSYEHKPAMIPETGSRAPTMKEITPLPNRYFNRRLTISAEQAGFVSECATCEHCKFIFKHDTLLETHLEKHAENGNQNIIPDATGLLCPVVECKTRCDSIATLIQHVKTAHSVEDIVFERVVFANMTDFKLWLSELERLTVSKYNRISGKRNVFSKNIYYKCQMSGCAVPGRKNADASKHRNRTSKKMGSTCTAFLYIKLNDDGTVLLRGCTKHLGHGCDPRLLPLSDDIKIEIAQLLVAGLKTDEIVAKMHKENKGDPNNRRCHIQPYEIRNVIIKIEKFSKQYMKKMIQREPLPNLAVAFAGRSDYPLYPLVKAKLACNYYPVPEHPSVARLRQNEPYDEEQEVEEDVGYFTVPNIMTQAPKIEYRADPTMGHDPDEDDWSLAEDIAKARLNIVPRRAIENTIIRETTRGSRFARKNGQTLKQLLGMSDDSDIEFTESSQCSSSRASSIISENTETVNDKGK